MYVATLKAALVVLLVVSMSHLALAAGSCAGDAILGAAIDVTNGSPTCHINDANDKVHLSANGMDDDNTTGDCGCPTGNRIDRPATQWSWSGGVCDDLTGTTNKWKAGTVTGSFTITATLHDKDDGAACDDDSAQATRSVIGFKVGVLLTTTRNESLKRWEDSTGTATTIFGVLALTRPSALRPQKALSQTVRRPGRW